jgi:hypothetical protein
VVGWVGERSGSPPQDAFDDVVVPGVGAHVEMQPVLSAFGLGLVTELE